MKPSMPMEDGRSYDYLSFYMPNGDAPRWVAYEQDEKFPSSYSREELKEIRFLLRKAMFQPLGDIPHRRILSLVSATNEELAERNSKRTLVISLMAIGISLFAVLLNFYSSLWN